MGQGEYSLKRLIVTADDFGSSLAANEAVETAHRDGILTTTCLMVGAPMAKDAIKRAKNLPTLKIGLHIVVSRGNSVLSQKIVPDLVDKDDQFDQNLVRAGFRYFFIPRVRQQLSAEIRAQFEAFRETGLPLDHANVHNHLHLHPTILKLIIEIGQEFGLSAVRLPYEPGYGVFLLPLIVLMKRKLRRSKIQFNDFIFGIRNTGQMNVDCLQKTICSLPEGVSEILLHPATRLCNEVDPKAAKFQFEEEFCALIDPLIQETINKTKVQLISFSDINKQA